jgi:hypothetical protein
MVEAVQELSRRPALHQMLIPEAEVEAPQAQMPIQIHSVTVDSLTVEPLLMPPHRLMEAVAAVIVLLRQMLRHIHMEAVLGGLVLQHRMQAPTLLEAVAVTPDLHLEPKAALTPITIGDLVANRVSSLHHL